MKFGVGVDYSLKALLMLAERYPSTQPLTGRGDSDGPKHS